MYYIFHGEEDFLRAAELKKLRDKMGDPQFAALNITTLDGRRLSFAELRHHADAVPFLADKRLVIVEGMLARLDPPKKRPGGSEEAEEQEQESDPELKEQLLAYLPHLPETTRLVFVETKTLAKNNPILKLAEKDKRAAYVRHFVAPSLQELPNWIVQHTERKGYTIEFSAANDLALYVGPNLRALDAELEKLIAYRHGERIRRQDVQAMVAPAQEANIFELVDAMGQRQTRTALELVHNQLCQNANEFYLLSMITRQYRLLLQIRDLVARGLTAEQIQKQLDLHPFVARKMLEQSRHYSVEQLERIMHRLLETDVALKTGRLEPLLAFDLLVIELAKM